MDDGKGIVSLVIVVAIATLVALVVYDVSGYFLSNLPGKA